MKPFEIITVSSHRPTQPYYCYDEFFKSVAKYGHEVTVLANDGSYKGLISKPKILKRWIDAGKVQAKKILFTDCWDVLFLDDPAKAVEMAPQGSVHFNSERNLFPFVEGEFPDVGTPYRYLNSGFFIGDTELIHELLNKMDLDAIPDDFQKANGEWHHENDQKYYLEAYVKQLVPITLDSKVEICQTLHECQDMLDIRLQEEGSIVAFNTCMGTTPFVFHGNGNGKENPYMSQAVRLFNLKNP